MNGQPVLLLQTIGRRSARRRITPLQYLADSRDLLVVASNAGAARPPAWYLNLRAHPQAWVDLGDQTVQVTARELDGPERAAGWERLTAPNRYLEPAARRAGHDLPVLALAPHEPSEQRAAKR